MVQDFIPGRKEDKSKVNLKQRDFVKADKEEKEKAQAVDKKIAEDAKAAREEAAAKKKAGVKEEPAPAEQTPGKTVETAPPLGQEGKPEKEKEVTFSGNEQGEPED